jgi:PAS domain S-box-containing protein
MRVIIITLVSITVTVVAILIIYRATLLEKKEYLKKLSINQVSIIKSFYKQTHDIDYLMRILKEQQQMHPGMGKTGEFTIGYRRHDTVFMLLHKSQTYVFDSIPFLIDSENNDPIKYASSKFGGFLIGKDYNDHKVLAYCDYIPELDWGIVTKIDFSEIRRPFYIASMYASLTVIILVFFGMYLFKRFSDPLITRITESEEKYRLLFEFIPFGITLTDNSGDILEANAESEKLLGIDKREQSQRKIDSEEWQIIRPDFTPMPVWEYASSIALKEKRKVDAVEMGIVKPDGKITWLSVSTAPFPLKDFGIIIVYTDISRRVEAERTLKQNEEQLKKNAEDLKAMNDTKDKFFRIIAHDLRNPFGSLFGAADFLYQNVDVYDRDRIRQLSRILYDSAKSGFDILSNLLEWSRSQTGNLSYTPSLFNLADVVQGSMKVISSTADSKNIRITSNIPSELEIFADHNMLSTILRNLLTNAVKFTSHGGSIEVDAEKGENEVTITVKDTGTGIPAEDLDKLFRIDIKYVKLGTENENGTGLGLILCKDFIEKHGGTIRVESEPGKGSRFIFTIPFITKS